MYLGGKDSDFLQVCKNCKHINHANPRPIIWQIRTLDSNLQPLARHAANYFNPLGQKSIFGH